VPPKFDEIILNLGMFYERFNMNKAGRTFNKKII